ncbi:VOC family protein [Nocardia acidivorans]|uniref:VOC family protein n=1 Tax=Nocardia acidivorans TaxID=404580 RepID=UPI00082A9869|nr:VOC family protein [Nocardia acidivorans]
MPELAGIHHIKIPVTDLVRSVRWYREVLGYRPTMQFDDDDGMVRGVAGELPGISPSMLCLRENPAAAQGCKGFDPVSLGARGRDDLVRWAAHLDENGVSHSPVIDASVGWLLVFNDPDGLDLHIYTWDEHSADVADRPGYGTPIADPNSWLPER